MTKQTKLFIFIITITTMLLPSYLFAEAVVNGKGYLEGELDHSRMMIEFIAQSPTANTDTAYTIADGSFSISLSDGVYEIVFSKEGFLTYVYPGTPTLSGSEILDDVTLQAGEIISEGNVSGIWDGNRRYFIEGNVSIPAGDTLTIQAGAEIRFNGEYSFDVFGLLIAQGTISDSIVFTSNLVPQDIGDWLGIRFFEQSDDNSVISYAVIEYAGAYNILGYEAGIFIEHSSPTIDNSTIRNNSWHGINANYSNSIIKSNRIYNNFLNSINGVGIGSDYNSNLYINNNIISKEYNGIEVGTSVSSSPTIINNKISTMTHTGIRVAKGAPSIIANTIMGSKIGIYSSGNSNIEKNILYNNSEAGIEVRNTNISIYNNTIFDNPGKGIRLYTNLIKIMHNIIVGNGSGIYESNLPIGETPEILYNLVWDNSSNYASSGVPGIGQLITINANGDSVDSYFNLSQDPLFISTDISSDGFLNLTRLSSCIDAGQPDSLDPDGTIRDFGAIYFNPDSIPAPSISNITVGGSGNNSRVISVTPGITWNYYDPFSSQQTNYHIQVGLDTNWTIAEMWDTGEISSSETFSVYSGNTLHEDSTYVLRARVFNGTKWSNWIGTSFGLNSHPQMTLNDTSIIEGDTLFIQLNDYISDTDDPDSLLIISSNGSDNVSVSINVNTHQLTVIPTENFNGTEKVSFTCTDPWGGHSTDILSLTTLPINDPPIIKTLELADAFEDLEYRIIISVTDADIIYGDSICFNLLISPEGMVIDSISGEITWVPNNSDVGDTTITVVVIDDSSATDSKTFSLLVNNTNDLPGLFTLLSPDSVTMVIDPDSILQTFIWEPSIDIDGDEITYDLLFSTAEWDTSINEIDTTLYRFNIEGFPRGVNIQWSVVAFDYDTSTSSLDTNIIQIHKYVGVEDDITLPKEYRLEQNYPNPFNPTTTIRYGLPETSDVTLHIYDITGRKIQTITNSSQEAGSYTVPWNGTSSDGTPAGTGLYFARIQAGIYTKVIKMVYLK